MARSDAPPLEPIARRWSLAAAAACLLPLLLQVPGTLALGIAAVALAIPMLAREGRAPTWLRLVLILALLGTVLTIYGFRFGRDTGCALLGTMLALKPVEMRSLRDARSLLGFALFAPFATFLLDQGPRTLVLGLLAALAVLTALLKLSEVEVGDAAPEGRPWRRFVTVARMIAIGLPLAMVVFWLFPRFSSPMWGVPERALSRPGLSDRMSPGDWIDLIADDSPALRATFFGEAPPQSQMYWRGPVLWDFDGRTWTAVEWSWGIGKGEAVPGPKRYTYELEVEPTDRNQLVALELPLAAPAGARLYKDFSLRSRQSLTAVTRWRMTSAPQSRLEQDLHPACANSPCVCRGITTRARWHWRSVGAGKRGRRTARTTRPSSSAHSTGCGPTSSTPSTRRCWAGTASTNSCSTNRPGSANTSAARSWC